MWRSVMATDDGVGHELTDAMLRMYKMSYEDALERLTMDSLVYGSAAVKVHSDGVFEIQSPYYEFDEPSFKLPEFKIAEPHQCVCDSLDLFRHGCKCGGV
jgi:hypothetical protein